MAFEITVCAERDIRDILRSTVKIFGLLQLDVYREIIGKGIAMVGDEPERLGSIARPDLGYDIRLFHLELVSGRSGGAAHCLYYTIGQLPSGAIGTIILRVLHENMEPRHKVVRAFTSYGKASKSSRA